MAFEVGALVLIKPRFSIPSEDAHQFSGSIREIVSVQTTSLYGPAMPELFYMVNGSSSGVWHDECVQLEDVTNLERILWGYK
jgi:hypothetical protein